MMTVTMKITANSRQQDKKNVGHFIFVTSQSTVGAITSSCEVSLRKNMKVTRCKLVFMTTFIRHKYRQSDKTKNATYIYTYGR